MKHRLTALSLLALSGFAAAQPLPSGGSPACADLPRAREYSASFVTLLDGGLYEPAWESATSHYRQPEKREEWEKLVRMVLKPSGTPRGRVLLASRQEPETRLAVFEYLVTGADGSRHGERVTVGALPADECGVVRYQVDIRRMTLTRLLDQFVANLNSTGGRFDYSPDSLIEIERVLMEHAPGGTPRARQTKGVDYRAFINFLGHYLGEVLIRHHGGNWSHTPNPEHPVLPWVLMPDGRRIDAYRMVADYARQPALGTLRQAVDRELSPSS